MSKKLKHGDLVLVEGSRRHWVILNIKKGEYKRRGINSPGPGLYGFGGMWSGRKIFSSKSYGKIQYLDNINITIIGKCKNYSIRDIKKLTN
jgi:hypothetical protein